MGFKAGIDIGQRTWIYSEEKDIFISLPEYKNSTDLYINIVNFNKEIKKMIDDLNNTDEYYIEEIYPYSLRCKPLIILEALLILRLITAKKKVFLVHPRHLASLKKKYPRSNFSSIKNTHQYSACLATLAEQSQSLFQLISSPQESFR